jgi:hypothetical protein
MSAEHLFTVVTKDEAAIEPYPYVYVDDSGTVRELHHGEREYLQTPFSPFDGGRPYVKGSYLAKNGWKNLSGFLLRSQLPAGIEIRPAPAETTNKTLTKEQNVQLLREKGFDVTENSDGTITARRRS